VFCLLFHFDLSEIQEGYWVVSLVALLVPVSGSEAQDPQMPHECQHSVKHLSQCIELHQPVVQ
jgi:hypothetical protein